MENITNIDNLLELEKKYQPLSLGDKTNPDKGQEFILWRGAKDARYELKTSLQVHLSNLYPSDWKSKIKDIEKNLLNRFLYEIEPHKDELNKQYHWFRQMPGRQDTVWILSVMQHYELPTRFADFTSCFWTAIFFASDGAKEDTNMVLYSLKCQNADNNDEGGNKLPKDSAGNPWRNEDKKVDINNFLGRIIGYGDYKNSTLDNGWNKPQQDFGWDRPAMENARIEKQKGFFVYPVDVSQTLEEILKKRSTEFKKYKISGELLPKIRNKLEEIKIDSWIVYLDLERAFKKFKEDIV